ncbi:MAG TPA: SDR family oxidoreductase [Allosphingosinicella sp.]|nr:SDR family oxidoreductase [Allosphingosinicella sp.]
MSGTDLTGKVAIVTGAARGIGLAAVHRLLDDGAQVLALDVVGERPQSTDSRIAWIEADVAEGADWQRAVEFALTRFGRLDILVNNAGISGFIGPLVDYPVESFDRVMAVNARGVFLGMKHCAPAMADGGSMVNISSVSGIGGGANTLAYTASKHAVIGMTKLAAIEFAPRRIRVNAVCPAPTATEMMFELAREKSPDDLEGFRRSFEQHIPLGRYGEASEVAAAIAFLASDEASFSTGAVLTVDGGMRAR